MKITRRKVIKQYVRKVWNLCASTWPEVVELMTQHWRQVKWLQVFLSWNRFNINYAGRRSCISLDEEFKSFNLFRIVTVTPFEVDRFFEWINSDFTFFDLVGVSSVVTSILSVDGSSLTSFFTFLAGVVSSTGSFFRLIVWSLAWSYDTTSLLCLYLSPLPPLQEKTHHNPI